MSTVGHRVAHTIPIKRTKEFEENVWIDLYRMLGNRVFSILDPSKSYSIRISKEVVPSETWLPPEQRLCEKLVLSAFIEENLTTLFVPRDLQD